MKVLIAEDYAECRYLLEANLPDWGYEVVATADGVEAWQRFSDEDFPLAIIDWMMPEMDGLELIRRIRKCQRPGYVYIILLTAKSKQEDVIEGMEAGADDFVSKPFDWDELRVRLRAGERVIRLEQTLADQNRTLRETQAALIQSEKWASLGQLAAGVAHEINNPIAYVSNNLTVLRRDVQATMGLLNEYREGYDSLAEVEPERAAKVAHLEGELDLAYIQENLVQEVDRSLQGLHRVRDIVQNLRDFARLDEADFKAVDLNAALRTTLEIAHHEIVKQELRLETDFEELPPVWCYPSKINQVFLNLLLNAVQACDPGGLIVMHTHSESADTVEVDIEDTGCGISAEDMPHLFEPFFTTKPVGMGMGLGLSVSYGIVRDHGGSIEGESMPGHGSRFSVRLPTQPPRLA